MRSKKYHRAVGKHIISRRGRVCFQTKISNTVLLPIGRLQYLVKKLFIPAANDYIPPRPQGVDTDRFHFEKRGETKKEKINVKEERLPTKKNIDVLMANFIQ